MATVIQRAVSKLTQIVNKNWGVPLEDTFRLSDPSGYANSALKYFFKDGQVVWQKTDTIANLKKAYEKCAPLSAILNSACDAYSNGTIEAYNTKKDGTQRTINNEWQALLDKPNWLQDNTQFFRQLYLYRKLFGWYVVLKTPSRLSKVPSSMWVIPNWMLRPEYVAKGSIYTNNSKKGKGLWKFYLCLQDGTEILLDEKDIIVGTDNTNTFDETTWLPHSRFIGAEYPITLTASILEAQTTLIQQKGAIGIISSNARAGDIDMPLSEEQKLDLQAQWRKYGLSRDKWQMMFSGAAQLNYTPIVFDVQQLQLREQFVDQVKSIAHAANYPFELTPFSDQKTYNNLDAKEKSLYQNMIIPDADSIAMTLAQGLGATEQGVMFFDDFTAIEALQQSQKEKGEGLRAIVAAMMPLWRESMVTKNMILEQAGFDKVANVLFDKYKYELTPEEQGIIEQGNGKEANQ